MGRQTKGEALPALVLAAFLFKAQPITFTQRHIHIARITNLRIMGEAFGERAASAARRAAGPARSLTRSQLCPPRQRRGPTTSPGPEMPNSAAPQRSPPESRYRYMRGPNISPGPRSRETEKKKFCELPAGSPGARGRSQSSRRRASRSPGPPAARGSGHLTGRLCALTPGRAEATAGHLLGTRFGACRSSRCSLGFSNKFQGGRRRGKKKKIQLCKWAPDWEARSGSDAATVRVLGAAPGRADLCGRVTATPGPAAGASRS